MGGQHLAGADVPDELPELADAVAELPDQNLERLEPVAFAKSVEVEVQEFQLLRFRKLAVEEELVVFFRQSDFSVPLILQ